MRVNIAYLWEAKENLIACYIVHCIIYSYFPSLTLYIQLIVLAHVYFHINLKQ